ncbi:TIGR01212 family radical SAM protein [Vagococcus intermedius]|uniref:TIGR01212 family radical SAM protein n=1 Tax=Vagococcus intermedius TaxID=2991418 RepID=A0AAF0CUH3_9ENTE|nr:TIGR01212 family radical SAM protein [Vagococcus intermedius]WEG73255.1 TIGR01212 family radical SAM protein [Vagococcus intermedius]WEG75339.1 TIGR01212 family radical SAM protein [Vagococcus intermedius]
MNNFIYTNDPTKAYHTWNYCLRQEFGEKIFKVPIDAGFDCPNRDGTVARGGCTFCSVSGSGDMILAPTDPLPEQFQSETKRMHEKWPGVTNYLVYFQNFTNTHGTAETIRQRFEQVLNEPGVVGLSIGTRPDCLPDDVIEYLAELNERFYLWVELGLQTTYEHTSHKINRAHDYQTYLTGVEKLRKHNIRVCTHLINGLPGETPEMMLENVRRTILDSDIQGIKLHLMHLMTNTRMVRDYVSGELQLMTKEDYVNVICDQLELIPPEIVIHRLTGDAPRDSIIGPMWSLKKWEVLNAIDAELKKRQSWQGKYNIREV